MNKNIFLLILIISIILVAGCTSKNNTSLAIKNLINEDITLYKSSSCGCCEFYKTYLEKQGFNINAVNLDDMISIKQKYNIPYDMQSCHTTIIGDYFVEGHIPIEAIEKLLQEKPDILGIALPGMPSGSPGMTGYKSGKFMIYSILKDKSRNIFMEI